MKYLGGDITARQLMYTICREYITIINDTSAFFPSLLRYTDLEGQNKTLEISTDVYRGSREPLVLPWDFQGGAPDIFGVSFCLFGAWTVGACWTVVLVAVSGGQNSSWMLGDARLWLVDQNDLR